jgi:hypothetical protein
MWLQHQLRQWPDFIPVVKGPHLIVTQDAGQHRLLLQQSELLTYAVPGTSAEGDVGIGVSLFYPLWQEVVRVELFGVGELISVPMDAVDMHEYRTTRGNVVIR